jgi:hypothetical protein
LCELIANALDEDPQARIGWADGVLTIADDGPGIPEEGLILGNSSKTAAQIGQFGEGKKLATLILARSPQVGAVRCETVGYGFTPTVQARRLLGGLIPSRSEQGTQVLVYQLFRTDRSPRHDHHCRLPARVGRGGDRPVPRVDRTRLHTTACARGLRAGRGARPGLDRRRAGQHRPEVAGLLRSAADRQNPAEPGPDGDRGRRAARRGPRHPRRQPRRRGHRPVRPSCARRRRAARAGTVLHPGHPPRARATWRTWARANLPDKTFYTTSGNEEAALDLVDIGFTEVAARGLSQRDQSAVMDLLGVDVARARQQRHYDKARDKTTWVADRA